MTNEKIKKWFQLVDLSASWSKDVSTKVGAVIIPNNSDVPILGYNGFPRNVEDLPERWENRTEKYNYVVHAELNCILNAAREGINIKDGTIFVSKHPFLPLEKVTGRWNPLAVLLALPWGGGVKEWKK
jgi:dCMP deaminase